MAPVSLELDDAGGDAEDWEDWEAAAAVPEGLPELVVVESADVVDGESEVVLTELVVVP
jgi:hypothetical protein